MPPDQLVDLVNRYGYLIIFLALVLENTAGLGIAVPGLTVMIAGGYFAALGTLSLPGVLIASFAGTVIGDNISYGIGRYGLARTTFVRRRAAKIEEITQKLRSGAPWLLLFFHFPVYSRVLVPVCVGIVRIPFNRWLRFATAGALMFSMTFVHVGLLVGRSLDGLDAALGAGKWVQVGATVAVTVGLAIFYFRRRRRSHEDPSRERPR